MSKKLVRLGSLCKFLNGGTPSTQTPGYYAGDIAWITGTDINEPIVRSARSYITKEAINNSATNFVPSGTLLLVTRTSVGKVALAGIDLCFSQDITAIIPDASHLEKLYLFQFLATKQHYFTYRQRGATIKGITREVLAELEIPLPPLAEQKRIAALLDEADTLRRKRRAALAKLDALLQSVFLDMFGDPVTNPKQWPRETISAFGNVVTGNTPSREQSKYYGGQLEWIKSDNINTPLHFLTTAQEYLSGAGREVSRVVPAGSILITCIAGSPDCIGNAAIANREVAFNQQINAITPYEKADTYFLYTQLLVAKRLVQNVSTNSMKGMVNKSAFSSIELICPPQTMRRSFADVFSQLYLQSTISRDALRKSEALFSAFEQAAFSGKEIDI